nr:retrovirus-related Pol polyprotein from transposon TNT 1-94 [Tanacetum cinerariifolium]
MGDEHLSIIPKTESYDFIKSSVENLVPSPSETKDFSDIESECDVPVCDDFTTFSNLLFDADDDFYSSDDESFSDENVLKEVYSNPLFEEEIISTKIDPHHFNVESDLIESLLNHDTFIISSPKIDSLLEEFSGEIAHIDLISSRINEAEFDPEEEIHLAERLLNDNSSPRPRKNLILKILMLNDSLSLPDNESFHFDVPSSLRPPAKSPDDGIHFDDEPVMGTFDYQSDLIVKGLVDSDYAGDLEGSISTTGYVFTFFGGIVSRVSKLQSIVAMSTTEAEYVAVAQASKEVVWLKMLLEELEHKQEKITLLYDNHSALYLARNLTFHSKTKHIRLLFHFVREKVEEGTVCMQKIYNDDNVADYLMKAINDD